MADYDRFVSYIYLYENGDKTINAGFAKVESRNNQCRINISMKNMYSDDSIKFKAYMFVRKNSSLLGIYIGDMNTSNHNGEFDGVTNASNIQNSGYQLGDVSGLIIVGENQKIYGTRWDDEALDVSQFVPVEEYDPSINEPEEEMPVAAQVDLLEREEELTQDEELCSAVDGMEEEALPDMEGLRGSSDGEFDSEEYESEPFTDEESGMEETETLPGEPEPELGEAFEPEPEPEPELQPEPEQLLQQPEAVPQGGQPQSGIFNLDSVTSRPVRERMSRQEPSRENIIENILEKGPRMYPFEDNDVVECIRMEPQDIGMLPMRCWIYGNNSFLLHGYYSYRHLILAKRKDGEYILGVPGINHNKDSFMANMFGFKRFKSIRSNPSETCEFGYWYVVLE